MRSKPASENSFERYGRLASLPSSTPLARDDTFAFWSDVAHYEIDGETEIGFCTVYNSDTIDWMERHHRTPELLVPIDRGFILPVMSPEGRVEAFEVEQRQAVVIGKGVWHSACKPLTGEQATYFVIFRRGTPGEDVEKAEIEPVKLER